MQLKKLAALAVSLVMATGVCGVLPVNTDFEGISVSASAASDFTIKKDTEGYKYVSAYTGKGGDITIPKDVSYIGKKAFESNANITSVTFPASLDYVEKEAFAHCKKLRKVTFEGDACIYEDAFKYCMILQSVEIKGSIYEGIGAGAFANCQKLTTVKIQKNKNEFWIGEDAFLNCYSLISMDIPSKCKEIYGEAFLNCFNLKSLTIPEKTVISDEYNGKYHFGYAMLFNTAEECLAWHTGEDDSVEPNFFVAGGKSGYSIEITYYPGTSYNYYYDAKQYSPKAITLTVTKDSPAEDWAKANKVKYTYAAASSGSGSGSSSGSTLAAPTGITASKTSSKITLSWNAVKGADAYRVYMYDPSTGEYEDYKTVSDTKCTIDGLKSGAAYKFKIAALKKSNGKYKAGKRSKEISVKTK